MGIQINEGHEIMISNSWLAQYYWDDVVTQNINCQQESSIGIQLNGNDHYVTNVIIFDCTKIGIQINRPANILMGVHTWNGGKIGIQVRAHQTRIIGCYLDYNSLDIYSPIDSIQVEDTFFFHTGIKLIVNDDEASTNTIDGLTIRHNSFNIKEKKDGDPIHLVGSPSGTIKNVLIVDNLFEGTTAHKKSTKVTKSMYKHNSTIWTFDFQNDMIFPSSSAPLENIQYSIVIYDDDDDDDDTDSSSAPLFFQHVARRRTNRSGGMIVDVHTSIPVNATVTMTVEQAV